MPLCLIHSRCTLQTVSDEGHMCCLTFDEMSVLENLHFNQNSAVLRSLRAFEATARQAVLQIMPWSSCCMVTVKCGSNQ